MQIELLTAEDQARYVLGADGFERLREAIVTVAEATRAMEASRADMDEFRALVAFETRNLH